MPVPLTTAALALSAILMGMGSDVSSILVGTAAVANQFLATWASLGGPEDDR